MDGREAGGLLVTTTPGLEGYEIKEYLGVISAQTVLGTGFFTEAAAWAADLFGVESRAIARKIEAAREASLKKLREKAVEAGADAVISTSFACSSNSRSMVSAVVTGTAVRAARKPSN